MESLIKYVHVVVIVALLTSVARADETPPQDHPLTHATKDSPWVNSLGLKFIPVPGKTGVFMCRTETRVRDFEAFVDDTGHDATGTAWTLETAGWKQTDGTWKNPHFPKGAAQTPDHPVVCVNWEDAQAFCKWLSGKEKGVTYRLPTDAEWSAALGSTGNYPWGDEFPPPDNAGNYAGSEANIGTFASKDFKTIKGFSDGAARTARVASYAANQFGFYDLSGNVIEWCEDRYRHEINDPDAVRILKAFRSNDGKHRVLRGGSWSNQSELLLRTSNRENDEPTTRGANCGFRCVVVLGLEAAAQLADETTSVNNEPTERTIDLQAITALSSMQFYTYFALVRNMLEGTWDDGLFKQCSFFEGINLQMMQRYEEKLNADKKWGPFFKMKNALHKKVYDDLEPLIRKKRKDEKLTAADLEKLNALDKLILERLLK